MDEKPNKTPKTPSDRTTAKPRNPFNQFVPATKTALRVRVDTTPDTKERIQKAAASRVPSNRPILTDGTPDKSPGKPPLSVITPNKSKLQKVLQFGEGAAVYADVSVNRFELKGCKLQQALEVIITQTNALKEKLKGITPQPEESKHMEASLTPATRLEQERLRKITRQRNPTQQQAMANKEEGVNKISATTVFEHFFDKNNIADFVESMAFLSAEEKAAFLEQLKFFSAEWLHLIDHANLGNKAQTPDDLVFGSRPANLQMMTAENYERDCLLLDKQTIDVNVEAKMIKETHFAYVITLTIRHPEEGNYKTSIEFNPFTMIRPVVGSIEYFKIVQREMRKRTHDSDHSKANASSFWQDNETTSTDAKDKRPKADVENTDMDAENIAPLFPNRKPD